MVCDMTPVYDKSIRIGGGIVVYSKILTLLTPDSLGRVHCIVSTTSVLSLGLDYLCLGRELVTRFYGGEIFRVYYGLSRIPLL